MFSLENSVSRLTTAVKAKFGEWTDRFRALPEESQTWLFGLAGLFGFTWLVGGAIFNASFMALVCCAALWALAVEHAPWGKFFCSLGVKGDACFTLLTFFFAGSTVGGMWSVFFMGVYFTIIRRCLAPSMDSFYETWEVKEAARKAEQEAEEAEREAERQGGEACLA